MSSNTPSGSGDLDSNKRSPEKSKNEVAKTLDTSIIIALEKGLKEGSFDPKLFNIQDIVHQNQGEMVIQIIEDYRKGKYISTNWGPPLHVFRQPELLMFYHSLVGTCIFDNILLHEKQRFIVEYFRQCLLGDRQLESVRYLQDLGYNKEALRSLVDKEIAFLMNRYIDKPYEHGSTQKHDGSLQSVIKVIQEIRDQSKTGHNMYDTLERRLAPNPRAAAVNFDYAIILLAEINSKQTQHILNQIINIARQREDFKTYTHIEFVLSPFGKQMHYNTSGSAIVLGEKNGDTVCAKTYMYYDIHGSELWFFDRTHYKIVAKEEQRKIQPRFANYYDLIKEIFPEGFGIVKTDFTKKYKVRPPE